MIIYIDENLSPFLARGFNILQEPLNFKLSDSVEVRSIKDDFGKGAKDEDWIPMAGESKACVITQDYNIHRIAHQRELCNKYKLGMFYFRPPSKSGLSYMDMLKLMVKHWEEITKIATNQKRPFTYKVTSRGRITKI